MSETLTVEAQPFTSTRVVRFTTTVRTTQDSTAEGDETFELSLTGDSRFDLGGQTSATVTIVDDDRATGLSDPDNEATPDAPEPVTASPAAIYEASGDGATSTSITITLNGQAGPGTSFAWAISGGNVTTDDFTLAAATGTTMTTASGGVERHGQLRRRRHFRRAHAHRG